MGALDGLARQVLAAVFLVSACGAAHADPAADLQSCAAIEQNDKRLACFDALAAASSGVSFAGFGNGSTDVFEITAPATLEYSSDDVVLIVYLRDDSGRLVQNLHLGGQGKAYYGIETPGRYRLQVDATGGWRMRVLPGPPKTP